MKVTVKKLSLCACGFPVLNTDIPLGTEYEVDQNDAYEGAMICGGCGTQILVTLIYAAQRGSSAPGFIPQEIFNSGSR